MAAGEGSGWAGDGGSRPHGRRSAAGWMGATTTPAPGKTVTGLIREQHPGGRLEFGRYLDVRNLAWRAR